jgi:succinoglycan biosynthesis protein ExoA
MNGATDAALPRLPDDVRVTVVVPARNAADLLGEALMSALAQPDVDEVVVAAADPGTRGVAEGFGDARVRVVGNASGTTPDGLNAAIEASTGQVVVRLDAHARLPEGYVATALAALRRTGAGNVGGRQVPVAESGFARCVAVAMSSPAGAGGASYRTGTTPGPADTVYLGVFRREALEAVGGFDTRFVRNQDAELNLRLRRAGFAVWFEPALAVEYRPRDRVSTLASQYLQYGRWRRLTARTHGTIATRQLAAPALVVGLLLLGVVSFAVSSPWPVGLAAASYGALLLLSAVLSVPRLRLAPGTMIALATMHLAWGTGFLMGPPRR